MTANPDPTPILYASISRGATILAELLSSEADTDLPSLAAICLDAAPQFHLLYTHTANRRLYAFLIAPPLVFFAIADDAIGRSSVLLFLHRLRDATSNVADGPFHRLCLQEEMVPVIRRLVGGPEEEEGIGVSRGGEEHEIAVIDNHDDDDDVDVDVGLGLVRRKSVERIWWRQVGIVVIIDVVVCGVMFGVWLCVCKGFRCVRG